MFKIGVVEDINDPLMLGRVRVRIIGLHTPEKFDLPTSNLPWSMCLSPSAQISGVGNSGCQYLCGSWVIISSLDGDAWQTTIVIGAFVGIPQDVQSTHSISGNSTAPYAYKIDGDEIPNPNQIPTENGGNTISTPADSNPQAIGPLTTADINKLKEVIAKHESGGNYNSLNSLGFIGKYQFGGEALDRFGYVRHGTKSKNLKNPEYWLGKDGVVSRDLWWSNHTAQESAMDSLLRANFTQLYNNKLLRNDTDKNHVCGCLMVSHLQGGGNCSKWLRGIPIKADAYGTTCEKYYNLGHRALSGTMPNTVKPTEEQTLPLNTAKAKSTTGFADPDGVYPKRSLVQEQDTNRLARGETLSGTVIGTKDASRAKNIPIAGTQDVWHEPIISASPTYPYNEVKVSRGGIIDERDSTPDNVRIHQFHPSGTFREVENNGTVINKIIGDNFLILERDGNVTIRGNLNVTIEGNCNLLVQNNLMAEVYGDTNVVSKNDLNVTSHGKISMYAQEDFTIKSKSFSVETFGGDINLLSSGNIDNKCIDKHNIDAQGNVVHRSGGSLGMESVGATSIKSGTTTTMQNTTFNVNSSSSVNVVGGSDISLKASNDIGIRGSNNVNIDCSALHIQEGMSASPTAVVIPSIPVTAPENVRSSTTLPTTPSTIDIRDLSTTGTYEFTTPSGTPEVLPKYAHKLTRQDLYANNTGVLPPTPTRFDKASRRYESPEDMDSNYSNYMTKLKSKAGVDESTSDATPSPSERISINSKNSKIVDTYKYDNFTYEENIPKGVQLSKNYSLLQFLHVSDHINKIEPQVGLSSGQIVQNLQYLAVNVAEKIISEYPEMKITSGYRYKRNSSNSNSQHCKGMAMDMQFPGKSKEEYYAIAKRITEILPSYDQVLLEYKNYGTKNPWIHVSYHKDNNREMVLTLYNGKTAHSGLANMA